MNKCYLNELLKNLEKDVNQKNIFVDPKRLFKTKEIY